MIANRRRLLFVHLLAGSLLAVGCGSSSDATPSAGPAAGPAGPGPQVAGAPAQAEDESGPFAAGKKVFQAQCVRCHRSGAGGPPGFPMAGGPGGPPGGGPGGPPGGGLPPGGGPAAGGPPAGGPPGGGPPGRGPGGPGRAPDLSHVGADPEHTVDWLKEFILNPKSKKPNARMQGFEGRISDADLQALAEYLHSLK